MGFIWLAVVVVLAVSGVVALEISQRRKEREERAQRIREAIARPKESISIPRRAVSTGQSMPSGVVRRVADSPLWIDPVVLANYSNYHQPAPSPEPAHFESDGGSFGGGGASASYDSGSCDSGGSSGDSGSCGGGCD